MHRLLVAVSLVFTLTSPAAAQTVSATTGALIGTVTDSTKAVLPGVTVTLSGTALMGTSVGVTDERGNYRFSALPPGDYRVSFELSGFRASMHEGIKIGVGFTGTLNVELIPGAIEETVTVSSQSPVVDVQTTSIVTRFEADKLAAFPAGAISGPSSHRYRRSRWTVLTLAATTR